MTNRRCCVFLLLPFLTFTLFPLVFLICYCAQPKDSLVEGRSARLAEFFVTFWGRPEVHGRGAGPELEG